MRPELRAQALGEISCRDLHLAVGETAQLLCTLGSGRVDGYAFRWESAEARYLRFLSDPAAYSPLFSAPSDVKSRLRLTYTLIVKTLEGLPVGQASLHVEVRPACLLPEGCEGEAASLAVRPPQVHCPGVVHLYELEMTAIECQATDPATGTNASLRYLWNQLGEHVPLSPLDVPNPVVVAPPVPQGGGSLSFPLRLTVTSHRSQQVAHSEVTVVVSARDPYLDCPEDLKVEPGASVVLACQGVDPLRGEATYEWTGLWGTSTAPLSATDARAPTFTAPRAERDREFHYVVRMLSSARSAQHRVTVRVPGVSSAAPLCKPLTLREMESRRLPCRQPEGHHLRLSGPIGPGAPLIALQTVTAPAVDADTLFVYDIEICRDHQEACVPASTWTVTVQNRKPPAVACTNVYNTYAGEADLVLHCAVSGGTSYTYVWTGPDTDRLSAVDVLQPTFDVPDQVAEDQGYALTLTVTDAIVGSSSADIHIRVRKRGTVELGCQKLEYFVFAGSADFPLQLQCAIAGALGPDTVYSHRWHARSGAIDTKQLSSTNVRNPIFSVPDTLATDYTYEYAYTVWARYADPASVDVHVTVSPFPASYEMTVSTAAVHFGDQSAGQLVTLDPLTDRISSTVRRQHTVGRMIFASDRAVDAEVELSGGMLYHQSSAAALSWAPQWSLSVSCLAPASQALGSAYAVIALREVDGGCQVLNFGGALDLRQAAPGPYAGNLDVVVRTGDVQETYLVPVYVNVVAAQRVVTSGPQSTYLGPGPQGTQRMTREQNVSIHPHRALLTPERPYGTFTLFNPSLITQEISLQPVFGYTEARADRSGESMVLAPTEAVGDLGAALLLYPKVFTLGPGQTRHVNYALRDGAHLPKGAYATFIEFSSRPRRYGRADRLPSPDDSLRVAHVTLSIQSIYIPTQGATHISATPLATPGMLLLEATGGSFEGEVVATDTAGTELGRRSLLLLTRRILQWPLALQPNDEVMLHFFTQHGNAPQPVQLRWP